MIKSISVCGDSFSVGAGLDLEVCYERSFGGIISAVYNTPLRVYGRSGCCNFTIYLQVKKVIEQYKNTRLLPFVIISLTGYDRLFLPVNGLDNNSNLDLSNVDYASYQPYTEHCHTKRPIEFANSSTPAFMSETINNIVYHYTEQNEYTAKLFDKLSTNQVNALMLYIKEIYNSKVKQEYDASLVNLMHNYLNEYNIPHIFLGHKFEPNKFIHDKNFININWGLISKEYPDNYKSGHCNEKGHQLVANLIIDKINQLILSEHLVFASSPS